MKILTSDQIKNADIHTIEKLKITSIDLMENAAMACSNWIRYKYLASRKFIFLCGNGNNGGDGLAIARIISKFGYSCSCFEYSIKKKSSEDYLINKKKLKSKIKILTIEALKTISFNKKHIIIDSIIGSGLNRPLDENLKEIISWINKNAKKIVSIDVPSGMFTEYNNENKHIINAHYTLTFQFPKLSFMLPEAGKFVGKFKVMDIGLDKNYIKKLPSSFFYNTKKSLKPFFKKYKKFDHKGNRGHLLLVAGSKGKIGASILAAKSSLFSGLGKLTVYTPKCGVQIMQTSVPEAMVEINNGKDYLSGEFNSKLKTIAIGPGIGTSKATVSFISSVLKKCTSPLIIDADAINILSQNKKLLNYVPKSSILTPHPKEFKRLVGSWENDQEKLIKLKNLSLKYQIIIVLKGAHTCISLPTNKIWFNSTGNPGMATAGSGDVLTGLLGGLLAQGYTPDICARLAVYLHGSAADMALNELSEETTLSGDIQKYLSQAFKKLHK